MQKECVKIKKHGSAKATFASVYAPEINCGWYRVMKTWYGINPDARRRAPGKAQKIKKL